MGPENKVDMDRYTLFLDGEPIEWGQLGIPEITVPEEVFEPPKMIGMCEYMEFSMKIKGPKHCRCMSRKRFIKLMMSEGIERNYAERLADFVRGWMPYGEAWWEYLWHKLQKG